MGSVTSLVTFYKQLVDHDWFYHYSDDSRVWYNGERSRRELQVISQESPGHKELFDSFLKYINGTMQGKKVALPQLPKSVTETETKQEKKKEKKMDTSSNVAVKMAAIEPGTWYPFEIYRLKGTPKYGVYWLKIQRGVPSQYHGMKGYENPETFNDTYFLSIWKGKCPDPKNFKDENGSVKVSKTQIKGDLETIGLVVSLIGKKGVNEVNVNPKNPTGKTATPAAEAYNF